MFPCLTRPEDNQFDLQLLTDPADQPLVIVGGGPEAVVDVECDQVPGAENQMEAEQQRDRIGPARNEHDTAIPFRYQSRFPDRAANEMCGLAPNRNDSNPGQERARTRNSGVGTGEALEIDSPIVSVSRSG